MASFFLDSCNRAALEGSWWTDLHRLQRSAARSRGREHSLATSLEAADYVLLTDGQRLDQADLLEHVRSRAFTKPVFVYSVLDHVIPRMPGIYASAEARWYRPAQMRAGFYAKVASHVWIQPTPVTDSLPYLYWFCGAFDTHPFRARLDALRGPDGLIRDSSRDEARFHGQAAESYGKWLEDYAVGLSQGAFVLCPRGAAPNSYRIFEAMKGGRAPVIVSDQWVAPEGPDWDACSIRIKEKEIQNLRPILQERRAQAASMGARARSEWEAWFSDETLFQTAASACASLAAERNRTTLGHFATLLNVMRPFYLRHYLLSSLRQRMRSERT